MDYKNFAMRFGLIVLGAAGGMLGYLTLTEYILPFEMAGFLLIISLIGASVITGTRRKTSF